MESARRDPGRKRASSKRPKQRSHSTGDLRGKPNCAVAAEATTVRTTPGRRKLAAQTAQNKVIRFSTAVHSEECEGKSDQEGRSEATSLNRELRRWPLPS